MSQTKTLKLFQACGIEMEYAAVDRGTLDVRPLAGEILKAVTGSFSSDADIDELGWSNELVLHVLEVKTIDPAASFAGLAEKYRSHVSRINRILEPMNARLMPGGMHPWMDPARETTLWPYENREIYETFDRIFNCRRHGWANLQSCQLNLPFDGDDEFGRLHAAVRFLLPVMPALSASTPVMEGRLTGLMDNRMEVYRTNAVLVPSITGRVIPEPVFTIAGYRDLLESVYRDIRPHDAEGMLQHEWINARGAIARFDRSAIEIRVFDTQECTAADLAICELTGAVLKAMTEEKTAPLDEIKKWTTEELETLMRAVIRDADAAPVPAAYARSLGLPGGEDWTAGRLWSALAGKFFSPSGREPAGIMTAIFEKGPLARRITQALGGDVSRTNLFRIYSELCACLEEGRLFRV